MIFIQCTGATHSWQYTHVLNKTIKLIKHASILNNYRHYHLLSKHRTNLIETCSSSNRALQSGKLLHAHLIVRGLDVPHILHPCSLIFYASCKHLSHALKLFDKTPKSNIRRWIVRIGALARYGFYQEAMDAFWQMQKEVQSPNKFVLPSVLKACGHLSDGRTGEEIHALILRYGFESDAFVDSALIDMYCKCGKIEKAGRVFDLMVEKDLVALNAMVAGYVQLGFVKEAMGLVYKMKLMGVEPNVVTCNTLIFGFSQAGDETMITKIFQQMHAYGVEPDVVSWTSVISGHVQNFRNDEAFCTFRRMLDSGLCPSSATISSLLPACASVANIKHGKELHGYVVVCGVEKDIYVRSALIDMYAKCGFISEANALFHNMSERNTVTWNSMIFGLANHGYCTDAIELFNKMAKEEETELDYLTFIAAFTACTHAGMLELGQTLFKSMQEKHGIKPRLEHYACMVDLLGRAGKLDEAYDMIQKMPMVPDLFVWGALLGACRQHGNIELAEVAANKLSSLEPENAGSTLLLSNLYADMGRWGNVARVKRILKKKKLTKYPGCSWIGTI